MKPLLLRILLVLAAVALVAYLVRDRLLPQPAPPTPEPPPFRPGSHPERTGAPSGTEAGPDPAAETPAPVSADAAAGAGDDLQAVKGIGPVYASRLQDIGITTYADLVAADAASLAERVDATDAQVADWIAQARTLAG